MSKKRIFTTALIIVMSLAVTAIAVKPRKIAPIKKTYVAAKKTAKVEKFLKNLMKVKTLDVVARAHKKAKFTKAELKQIDLELKKKKYSKKLSSLYSKKETAAKSAATAKIRTIKHQKQRALKQKQQRELTALNKQAQTKLSTIKARTRGKAAVRTTVPASLRVVNRPTTTTAARSTGARSNTQNMARIQSCTPQPAAVGGNLTINGRNFGTQRGRVTLGIADLNVSCSVVNWRRNRVVITIPSGLESIVGEMIKNGRVWVHAEQNIATSAIRVGPDTARLAPVIRSLSASQLRPGQDLIIEGEHFLEREGTVNFRCSTRGRTFHGVIKEWNTTSIRVGLASNVDLVGIANTPCDVVVTNNLGLETSRRISLVPPLATDTLVAEHTLRGGTRGNSTSYRDHQFRLINGWRVTGTVLIPEGGGRRGASWNVRPGNGSTDASCNVSAHVDAWHTINVYVAVIVEGPAGLPAR